MKEKEKVEKTIVCRYGEFGTIELEVMLDKSVPIKKFTAMRRRLLRRERGVFFTDVVLEANSPVVLVNVGAAVRAHQLASVITIFSNEVNVLMGSSYCIDCSLLYKPPPRRKPLPVCKGR